MWLASQKVKPYWNIPNTYIIGFYEKFKKMF